jgi:hypothetical protein
MAEEANTLMTKEATPKTAMFMNKTLFARREDKER